MQDNFFMMKKILVLGAGRSSTVLINYLLDNSIDLNAFITVADQSLESAMAKIHSHPHGAAVQLEAGTHATQSELISKHDLVISMLPPHLHYLVAKDCVQLKKHLLTASYLSAEMQLLNEEVKRAGLLFMCEMGLDPGIDHMSAMKIIHKIKNEGGQIHLFKSGTGGLVAPESDDNPWHYKVTWNPRNVVLAGQGTAQYLENGINKFVPYHRIFSTKEKFKIDGYGKFESYPNRDSLLYISKYELEGIKTILRSTLRKQGFCDAWDALIRIGITDDTYTIENASSLSYSKWLTSYLPEKKKNSKKTVMDRTAKFLDCRIQDDIITKMDWLGLFSEEKIKCNKATPAQILQQLIEEKWMMKKGNRDLVVMRHEFGFSKSGKNYLQLSTLVVKGDDDINTAMAKTVGLPLAILAKLLLQSQLFLTGVHIPVMSQVYEPVLKELEISGINFVEKVREL